MYLFEKYIHTCNVQCVHIMCISTDSTLPNAYVCMVMYGLYMYVSVFPKSMHTYRYILIQIIQTDTSNIGIHTIHTDTYRYIHILLIHTFTYDIPLIYIYRYIRI